MFQIIDKVEIFDSALKHGVSKEDIFHALRNPIRLYGLGNEVEMLIGAARNGSLLEIGIADKTRIIHAMKARSKYTRCLK